MIRCDPRTRRPPWLMGFTGGCGRLLLLGATSPGAPSAWRLSIRFAAASPASVSLAEPTPLPGRVVDVPGELVAAGAGIARPERHEGVRARSGQVPADRSAPAGLD
jgi:hypothetical protein